MDMPSLGAGAQLIMSVFVLGVGLGMILKLFR